MERKKVFQVLSIVFIATSIFLAIFSLIFAFSINNQRESYLKEEDIYSERFSVKTRDDIEIKGILYVDEDLEEKDDHSVPTILILHGVNGRKEHKMFKFFQLVKLGYAVFTVDQRGHGESGGLASFLEKEPDDMGEVIDYIEEHYEFSDSKHIALLGFSYGGGVGAILQAEDDRVFTSVLYHPLVSIDNLIELMPFQNLFGKPLGAGEIEDIEDGLDLCSPRNTKNLLLIHGEDDDLISTDDSEELYEQIGGCYRNDIGLEIRTGLNHYENEEDDESFKYAIIWLEHFYHNPSINITTNRELEISLIKFHDYDYPESSLPQNLILVSALLLFVGVSLLLLSSKIWPLSDKQTSNLKNESCLDDKLNIQNYKKMLLTRIIIYIVPVIICAPIVALINPSYMYGYALMIPIVTIILFYLMPRFQYSDWKTKWKSRLKSEWNNWYQNNLLILIYGLLNILIPVLFYVLIFNINAYVMVTPPIPFFNSTMILYILMAIVTFYMDYLLVRDLKLKHSTILIVLRSLSLYIFFMFVPVPPFLFTGVPISGDIAQILIISLIGFVFWIVIMIMLLLKKIYKNIIPVILMIFFPLIVFLLFLFLRLF